MVQSGGEEFRGYTGPFALIAMSVMRSVVFGFADPLGARAGKTVEK